MSSAKAVAAYLVKKANAMGNGNSELGGNNDLTNPKLQKMLFFAQSEYIKEYGEKLFPEPIEAWQFGPVVSDVYDMLKHCQSYVITEFDMDTSLADGLSQQEANFLDKFFDKYMKYSAWELVNRTHKKGSAWDKVYRSGKGNKQVISTKYISNRNS